VVNEEYLASTRRTCEEEDLEKRPFVFSILIRLMKELLLRHPVRFILVRFTRAMVIRFWIEVSDITIEDIMIPHLDRSQDLSVELLRTQQLPTAMNEWMGKGEKRRRKGGEKGWYLREGLGSILVNPQLLSSMTQWIGRGRQR
jgi:hypothetical protein